MAKTTITGKLTIIKPVQSSKTGSFTWQEIIIDDSTNPDYDNPIPVQVSGEMMEDIEGLKEGQDIEITCWVNGSYWEAGDRHFSKLKLASIDSAAVAQEEALAEKIEVEKSDELPF